MILGIVVLDVVLQLFSWYVAVAAEIGFAYWLYRKGHISKKTLWIVVIVRLVFVAIGLEISALYKSFITGIKQGNGSGGVSPAAVAAASPALGMFANQVNQPFVVPDV